MGHLLGLDEYLDEAYNQSVFDQALASDQAWGVHLHGDRIVRARVLENLTYDLKLDIEGKGEEVTQKTRVKFLYPADLMESVKPFVKMDKKVKALDMEPIAARHKRYFVKNKSLFPLMKGEEVLFFTLLEGDVVKGIVAGFSRYEVTVHMKGGIPVTILRHSIYDLRNKKGRCFMKSFQEKQRDWERSEIYVS